MLEMLPTGRTLDEYVLGSLFSPQDQGEKFKCKTNKQNKKNYPDILFLYHKISCPS